MIAHVAKRILNGYILLMIGISAGAALVGAAGKFAYTLHMGPNTSVNAQGQPEVQLTDVVVTPDTEPGDPDEILVE